MTWHIIECTRGRESKCARLLERLGYPGAWYPTRTVLVPCRRSARRTGQPTKRITRAWVNGYLFLPADAVDCYRINGTHDKLWLRVLAPGGVPYRVKDADMAQMRDVPSRVRDAIDEAIRAEREALRAVTTPGARVQIVGGVFEGSEGEVTGAGDDGVRVELPVLGKVVVPAKYLQIFVDT